MMKDVLTPKQIEQANPFLQQKVKHNLIDGKHVPAASGKLTAVRNPATGEVIAQVAESEAADVDVAVQAARRAFESNDWSRMRPADRELKLLRLADLMEKHAEELAQLETINQGKLLGLARGVEVNDSIQFTRYMAGWATKIEGSTLDISIPIPPGARYHAYTKREPVGVVGAIIPWNFSLMSAIWKIAPALTCGCTIVLKPAEWTPLTALRLGELALEAGFPPGVVNIVTGDGTTAGAALSQHRGIDKMTFTGSTEVGKLVGHAAVENMTRFTLELGGKSPQILLEDVDPAQVGMGITIGGMFNQGQCCAAGTRIYVHHSKYEQTVDVLSNIANGTRLGNGLANDVDMGPVISREHQNRIMRYMDIAKAEGVTIAAGGTAENGAGYFVRPTILATADNSKRVVQEEIFGPVLVVLPFSDVDEAVEKANDNRYGLSASVWSNNLTKVMDMVPRIKAGTVWVNVHVPLDPNLPFGGYKQSGTGREFGKSAIDGFTELKSVAIAY
jgi:phenylacetaldehyde dehydrogenase